ncbi:MAG: alpha-ketoglutarate-dependent dioxygenase AlkB [Gammaproteobacteria bacterium]
MVNLINEDGEYILFGASSLMRTRLRWRGSLMHELAWREEYVLITGRRIPVPRLVCWYGDPGAHYAYSGTAHAPLPWTPTVKHLRERIEILTYHSVNSVLANLYRDGNDPMGWHAGVARRQSKGARQTPLSSP